MKAKKILFKVAGILQIITSSILAFFSGIILLLRPLLNMVIESAYTEFQAEMKDLTEEGLAEIDEGMRFLLDASKEEFSAFFLKWSLIFATVMLAIAVIGFIFGIIFVKMSKKYEYLLAHKTNKKIWFGILSAICCGIMVPTVLVIVALCVPDEKLDDVASIEINN
jgi:preprotein translocase subunit Sss1